MTPLDPTFTCFACHHDFRPNDANLDAQNNLICGECYGANPPIVDVERRFNRNVPLRGGSNVSETRKLNLKSDVTISI